MATRILTHVTPMAEIYIFECVEYLKVGWAQDAKARAYTLQTGNPFLLNLIEAHQVPASLAYEIETKIHKDLASFQVRREWFRAPLTAVRTAVHLRLRNYGYPPAPRSLRIQQGLTQEDVDFLKDETYEADGRSEFVDGLPRVRLPRSYKSRR